MSTAKTPSRPAQASPLGHGYCWQEHPTRGKRCTQPAGHKAKGVEHLHPYTSPPLRWP